MFNVLSIGAGLLLAALVLRDVFHQIFIPHGSGGISSFISRTMWGLCRRIGRRYPRVLELAGPSIVAVVIGSWTLLMATSWALIYWPRLPHDFRLASGVPASGSQFADAFYFSMTAMTTVGFGDLTPLTTWMRLASVTEAAIGFGLATASVSWLLSLYPVLQRRRAAAVQIVVYCDMDVHGTGADAIANDAGNRLIDVAVDVLHFPTAYYFDDAREEESLPRALARLRSRLASIDEHRRGEGLTLLAAALDRVVAALRLHPALADLELSDSDLLDAYIADQLAGDC